MTAANAEQIVQDYITRLDRALARVGAIRRDEIITGVREHLAAARATLPDETDADLRNIVERLGDPADVAASADLDVSPDLAASADLELSPDRAKISFHEIAALILTPLLWPAGVILLWTSRAWTTRDKLIGTLLPPGGYIGIVLGINIAHAFFVRTGVHPTLLLHLSPDVGSPLEWSAFALTIASPILIGIYLVVRLRRADRDLWAAERVQIWLIALVAVVGALTIAGILASVGH